MPILSPSFRRSLLAEFIGSYALVFCGCGAVAVDSLTGALGNGGIAACFGLVVMAMIYSVGNVSGAHFNPAVSFGFWLAGRFPLGHLLPYTVVQSVAAISAAFSLLWLMPETAVLGLTKPHFGVWQGFVMEVLITGLLMFVILNVATGAKEKGIIAGAAIGATVALAALFAGPFTGASMNPARSLGPALASSDLAYLWLYWTAPFIGAALAVVWCRSSQAKADCC